MDQYNNIYIQDYLGLFEKTILPIITIITWPFFITTSLLFKITNFINDVCWNRSNRNGLGRNS